MTSLREAAQAALEALECPPSGQNLNELALAAYKTQAILRAALEAMETGLSYPKYHPVLEGLRAALAEPTTEESSAVQPVQEPYTDDVTRIMRDAGMTFHLGLPHKAVVEQMTRVVDLVYAESSIKAAQQFAAAPPQRPAEPVGVVTSMVKGGVTWHRWPADMPDGTHLYTAPPQSKPMPAWLRYCPASDILTIHGRAYSGAAFAAEALATALPQEQAR